MLSSIANISHAPSTLLRHGYVCVPPAAATAADERDFWKVPSTPGACEMDMGEERRPAGRVDQTTIDSLGLEAGRGFGYWFDFGDDWWHQINVEAIEDKIPKGQLPKVTKKVGKSPPQYPDEDE